MPDTPPAGGGTGVKITPSAIIVVAVALALAAYVASIALSGPDRDPAATAPVWTPIPVEPATESATESATDFYDDPTPTPTSEAERAFVVALSNAAVRGDDLGTLDDGREICGAGDADPPAVNDLVTAFHDDFAEPSAEMMELSIRHLCPKYVPLLAEGKKGFTDGSYTVGDDIKPGTYRTNKRITDCYWERSTPGGSIIANNFISNAPAGVTVTVRSGEGFTSRNCGNWMPA
ncbi:hypothetical protein AB0K40_39115 [Nonomuraea bangladeshensis]|uniref:DUF732 domain-containing protein n=1 Tax=Nonomuraea bangladeshensis TaxID=404385 RepID=A0ABV3HG87_9ACTN